MGGEFDEAVLVSDRSPPSGNIVVCTPLQDGLPFVDEGSEVAEVELRRNYEEVLQVRASLLQV